MTLKMALIYSGAVHLALLMVQFSQGWGWPAPRPALEAVELAAEPAAVPPAAPQAPAPVPERKPSAPAPIPLQAAPPATWRSEVVRPPSAAAAPRTYAAQSSSLPPVPRRVDPPVVKSLNVPSEFLSGPPEWEFAEIQYKEQVRKHLKAHLNYPAVLLIGTVRLRLVLSADGHLQQAQVLEASDPRLQEAALRDAQSSQPYPSFPGAMRRRQAAYEYLVRYEPE